MPKARFDWLAFCENNRIEYVTHGRNVSQGHIAIKCPLCGEADPSQHMVLCTNASSPYWRCWRDPNHRGGNPTFLVARLLRIPTNQAQQLVDGERNAVDEDEWSALVNRFHSRDTHKLVSKPRLTSIKLPRFVLPMDNSDFCLPFRDYLRARGFYKPLRVAKEFDLHYAIAGEFAYRVVFPVHHDGKLVNLVGRDITGNQRLRYKALPSGQGSLDIDQTVYNYDEASDGGKVLWICEGPFDALKVMAFADPGHVAVALFGMAKTSQVNLLSHLAKRFELTMVALDTDAISKGLHLSSELTGRTKTLWLSGGENDLGALSGIEVKKVMRDGEKLLTCPENTRN